MKKAALAITVATLASPMAYAEAKDSVGKFSRGLASSDRETLSKTTRAMKDEIASRPVEAMYVAAIRLYDTGARDEALYWFYAAQYRARLFAAWLDPARVGGLGAPGFELRSAHAAFYELSGPFINGYAGCDQKRWLGAIEQVLAESSTPVDLAAIYPGVSFIKPELLATKSGEIRAGLEGLDPHGMGRDRGRAERTQSGCAILRGSLNVRRHLIPSAFS